MTDASGRQILDEVFAVASTALGDRLLAGYALGSLAHGGFSPQVSDIDAALILADPAGPADRDTVLGITDQIRGHGSVLHSRVSLFWATPGFLRTGVGEGRFPPLDRLCLFEHGRLLSGTDVRAGLPRPGRTELLVAGAEFALEVLADQVVACATNPPGLLDKGVRRTTKTVLFPVRFIFTADTGCEGTNDAAVRHYSARHRGPAAELVNAAFQWRTVPPADAAAAALLSTGFVALYDGYLADHIQRLQTVGEKALAARFRQWRSRLLAAS